MSAPGTLPITPVATISPDLTVVCVFSLLGLTLSAVVMSCVSSETISIMFSSIGWRCPNRFSRFGELARIDPPYSGSQTQSGESAAWCSAWFRFCAGFRPPGTTI